MPKIMTQGWYSERDLTNQCANCYWVLIEHSLACCEFDKPCFPLAVHCEKFSKDGE